MTAEDDGTITVRTTNKKYFKKISVPDLERVGAKPERDRLSFNHQFNTLIITVSFDATHRPIIVHIYFGKKIYNLMDGKKKSKLLTEYRFLALKSALSKADMMLTKPSTICTQCLQYKKPPAVLYLEKEVLQKIMELKASKDGDVQCPAS